jgi:hypothetical protein
MDTNTKQTESEKLNGLFVRAVVMSSTAKALRRKDGTGSSSHGMNWHCSQDLGCGKRFTTRRMAR